MIEEAVDALLETALLAPTTLVPTNDSAATDLKLRIKRKINYSSKKVITYVLACSLIPLLTHSLTRLLACLFACSLMRIIAYSLHSLVCSLIH